MDDVRGQNGYLYPLKRPSSSPTRLEGRFSPLPTFSGEFPKRWCGCGGSATKFQTFSTFLKAGL